MLRKYLPFLTAPWIEVFFLALAVLLPDQTNAATGEFEGISYHTLQIDPAKQTLRLFWKDAAGQPYQSFRALDASLRTRGERLAFAMNAGIYEPGWIPSGLHVEEGKALIPLNLEGPPPRQPGQFTPNFYLLPNGVFYLLPDHRAGVLDTAAYAGAGLHPRIAVQSGPLLLSRGRIHPAFQAESTSRLIRNGVGVDHDGRIHFVSINRSGLERPNLHTFARLFLHLGCPDALYLDGDISEFYLRADHPEIQATTDFAAIFAVTEPDPR